MRKKAKALRRITKENARAFYEALTVLIDAGPDIGGIDDLVRLHSDREVFMAPKLVGAAPIECEAFHPCVESPAEASRLALALRKCLHFLPPGSSKSKQRAEELAAILSEGGFGIIFGGKV
jgi:hypothetical protein